ncbi:activating signal cointegrator 1-like isoform X1 [Mya arenaria]|uniref:activating signal cointegrator 1-like isoform X1 n=1 Tax=Mya arenaria TaxID=6604 RepID=UPI0022E729AC|nr:activating signal cointegrator 1-like isoform X1 [Mya arenaria]
MQKRIDRLTKVTYRNNMPTLGLILYQFIRYILSIESSEDLEEYMLELLDRDDRRTKPFLRELIARWGPYHDSKNNTGQIYQKSAFDEEYIVGKEKRKNTQSHKDRSAIQKKIVVNGYDVENRGILPGEERATTTPLLPSPRESTEKEVKKKQKFVPLYSKEGQAVSIVQLPGRHVCECQAAKHRLVNNCSRCGRVVCEQEGAGPCLFCGHLVCTREDEEVLSRGSRKSEKLRQHLMREMPSELLGRHLFSRDTDYLPNTRAKMQDSLTVAQKHKEKLLEYDKNSVRRTQVIDDEADYFSTDSNQWLNQKDREQLRKREEELRSKRYVSRKDRKITLDFAGRQVIEEDPSANVNMYDVTDDIVQKVNFGARPKEKNVSTTLSSTGDEYLVNPLIDVKPPKFVPQGGPTHAAGGGSVVGIGRSLPRIQDRELQEMSDQGMCMSMHQPWASLLVAGIKVHEGRTWFTAHRGRLWIAATAKTPEPAEVADMEDIYRQLYDNRSLEFPSHYPTGCLLGCVDVIDCLPQDTYREKFPDGESASPFVFICDNPLQLLVKFPIKGKHKIYNLESHIHKAAKKGLR